MLGTLDPTVSLGATTDVTLANPASEPLATHDTYPAPEKQVFTYREGGFYGTIFSNSPPPPPPPAPPPLPPNEKFACASEIWNFGAATAEDRLCAGPMGSVLPEGCFGHPPGRCDAPGNAPLCKADPAAASGSKVYDACPGGERTWDRPYTTYLSHPCDLFETDEACVRLLDGDARKGVATRLVPARPVRAARGPAPNDKGDNSDKRDTYDKPAK
jgi:hypothetical protein